MTDTRDPEPGAADRVAWNGTTIERQTMYGPEERLTRDELWLRYRLALQVLETVADHLPDQPDNWSDKLVVLALGTDDSSAPRVKGSLADPCDAIHITHTIDADGRKEVDRHFCVYRRGHAEQPDEPELHCTVTGIRFHTGDIAEQVS